MTLARLHVVTDDAVLADPGFRAAAIALLEAHGEDVALPLRSPAGHVRTLMAEAEALAGPAQAHGGQLVVNDRPDVALAAGAHAVQLGRRSIPVRAARALLGADAVIGYSAHGAAEAASAAESGADYVVIGTIWETASHPGREGAGLDRVRETVAATDVPVLAIGGVTPARARAAVEAGARGVAVIRGVWSAARPIEAVAEYLGAMQVDRQ